MPKQKSPVLEDFLTQVGNNVRELREGKDLSMGKLGLEVGLTRMQIRRIEQGYNITLSTILKLSLALDVPPSDLLNYKVKNKKSDLEELVNTNKASKLKTKPKKEE